MSTLICPNRSMPRYCFGEFVLSPRRRLLLRNGREQPLIPRYFDLLVFLIPPAAQLVQPLDPVPAGLGVGREPAPVHPYAAVLDGDDAPGAVRQVRGEPTVEGRILPGARCRGDAREEPAGSSAFSTTSLT